MTSSKSSACCIVNVFLCAVDDDSEYLTKDGERLLSIIVCKWVVLSAFKSVSM